MLHRWRSGGSSEAGLTAYTGSSDGKYHEPTLPIRLMLLLVVLPRQTGLDPMRSQVTIRQVNCLTSARLRYPAPQDAAGLGELRLR